MKNAWKKEELTMIKGFLKRGLLLALTAAMLCCCACVKQQPQPLVTETTSKIPPIPTPPPVNLTEPTEDPMKQVYLEDPTAFVVFGQFLQYKDVYVPMEEIMAYESQYPDCNGTWYRNQLEGEDLCIYNCYLYAMEHCYTDFELYVEDNDRDFDPIRQALSLDSPFLAQNLSRYEDIHDWPSDYIGEKLWISMNHFAPDRWEMKMEALEKCRQIVAEIPVECSTQPEKMEYLYRYVCDHVEYVDYEKMDDEDYLHDAVVKGQTVCDGYSNMLQLLFRLIGVECCEVMGSDYEDWDQLTPEEQETAAGHTWVVAKVDGEFYHFDATFEDTKDPQWEFDTMYFGFSDTLVKCSYMDLEEYRPKCTDTSMDFDYSDLGVSTFTETEDVKKIAELTSQRAKQGEYTTIIGISEPFTEKKYDKMFEKYCKYAKGIESIQITYVAIGNGTILWLTVEPS